MDGAYETLYARGSGIRDKMLGEAWIDSTREGADTFGAEGQDTVTSLVWGGIWARPGLSLRDRSLITVAVVAALNQTGPLELHIAAALRNGCTLDELQEAFLQIGAYAGFCVTTGANVTTRRVLAKLDEAGGAR